MEIGCGHYLKVKIETSIQELLLYNTALLTISKLNHQCSFTHHRFIQFQTGFCKTFLFRKTF